MLLDEFAAGFDLVAHQHAEEIVGAADVFHADLQQRAVGGVERGFAEFFRVHFTEAFKPRDLQAFFAGVANGSRQAAEVFEAGFVFATAERVAASFFAGAFLGNEGFDSEAEFGEVGEAVLIVRTSWSSTIRSRGAFELAAEAAAPSPLVLGTGALRRETDVDVEFAAGFFFLGGDEVIELSAGGEPLFAAVQVDVVDRAGGRSDLAARHGFSG